MSASFRWYSPIPSELDVFRVTLSFGLRSDDLFYRGRVVPGAGRVRHVRELSWAVGALALHRTLGTTMDLPPSAVLIAHGLEAVGFKLAWRAYVDGLREDPPQVTGLRAFGRDRDEDSAWSFAELSSPRYYVVNTHRQRVTRALRIDGGLGLTSGTRFARMRLTPAGFELAQTFLGQPANKGRGRLETSLVGWISDSEYGLRFLDAPTVYAALVFDEPSEPERAFVRRLLFQGKDPPSVTRTKLRDAFRGHEELPDIDQELVKALERLGAPQQARELVAARAFGAVQDAVLEVAVEVFRAFPAHVSEAPSAELARHEGVAGSLDSLRGALEKHRDRAEVAGVSKYATGSSSLLDVFGQRDPGQVLVDVLGREPRLFTVSDGRVGRGPLFGRLGAIAAGPNPSDQLPAEEESEDDELAPRRLRDFLLSDFFSLVRECDREGSR